MLEISDQYSAAGHICTDHWLTLLVNNFSVKINRGSISGICRLLGCLYPLLPGGRGQHFVNIDLLTVSRWIHDRRE